jgi:hypothetical protein
MEKQFKRSLRKLGFKNLELPKSQKNKIKRHRFEVLRSYKNGELQVVGVLVHEIVLGTTVPTREIPTIQCQVEELIAHYLS